MDDLKTPVQTVLNHALNGDEMDNFEFPLISKNGYCMEMELNATSQQDEQRNVIGMVGISQDITNQFAQETEYSKLSNMANEQIFGANTQEAVNVLKKNAQKLIGYTPKEGMGKILVKEFITNEYKMVAQAMLDQAFQGEETVNFEFPLMMEVGVHLDTLLNAMTHCNEQGNISGVVSIGQDITGQLAQEQEYSCLIDTANALMFGVDTLGCINLWNKSASQLIGFGTEEVMGCPLIQEFITINFNTAVQAVLVKMLEGDETKNFKFPLFTKSGTHFELLITA